MVARSILSTLFPLELSTLNQKRDEAQTAQSDTGLDNPDHSRLLLAAIVECSDDAIISKDLNGIITSWNGAASRMFGYMAEEIVGQSILRLIPEDLYHEEDMIQAKLRTGERIDHYETTRVRKNGEKIDVSVTISPIKDSAGKFIGASKIARDISERKLIERLLIQSEKLAATGRMAATIAHEINNPLEAVVNLVFLARKSSSINKARLYLETAEKELERVSHIVRQTLGYYRDTGAPVEVCLHELIEDVLTVYQSKLSAQRISVDCRFDDRRLIVVSKGELMQVFSNIIINSVDAMPNGGNLHIEVRETTEVEEGLQVVVRDQGSGIPEENLSRIFEPFFTTKKSLGTGIGLWIAKQVIERHRGKITVASSTDPKNKGTTVSIFLPFAESVPGTSTE